MSPGNKLLPKKQPDNFLRSGDGLGKTLPYKSGNFAVHKQHFLQSLTYHSVSLACTSVRIGILCIIKYSLVYNISTIAYNLHK